MFDHNKRAVRTSLYRSSPMPPGSSNDYSNWFYNNVQLWSSKPREASEGIALRQNLASVKKLQSLNHGAISNGKTAAGDVHIGIRGVDNVSRRVH